MDDARRKFLKSAGLASSAIMAGGVVGTPMLVSGQSTPSAGEEKIRPSGQLHQFSRTALQFSYPALQPYIDSQTVETHHVKVYGGDVTKLNAAERELALARTRGDYSLVQHWSRMMSHYYCSVLLHRLYFDCMDGPKSLGGGKPDGYTEGRLKQHFGGVDKFRAQFTAAAESLMGNGWVILLHRPFDERMVIQPVENNEFGAQWGATPVLVLDVWEHAYFQQYQDQRRAYIDAWWHVVKWQAVRDRIRVAEENR